jgi:hypothetical protein
MTNPDVISGRWRPAAPTSPGLRQPAGGRRLEGKGIVQRRTDPNAFEKGKTIAATPGAGRVREQAVPADPVQSVDREVAAEPLLYVPPLVNRYYMIDLVPRQSLVKWLVDEGRTVFVISWVNPTESIRTWASRIMSSTACVEAIEQVARADRGKPDLFSFCLGGTLAAIALGLAGGAGPRRGGQFSATLIGAMVDFADMRDWSAFVHEAHLDALEDHLEAGLRRQPGAAAAVRGDARQRPHLVVGGEPLSARPPCAAVGPALLVRGRRADPGGVPQELQSRAAAREPPARSPARSRCGACRSTSRRSRRRSCRSRSRTITSRPGKRSTTARGC